MKTRLQKLYPPTFEIAGIGYPGRDQSDQLIHDCSQPFRMNDLIIQRSAEDYFVWLNPSYDDQSTYFFHSRMKTQPNPENWLRSSSALFNLLMTKDMQKQMTEDRLKQPFNDPPEDILFRGLENSKLNYLMGQWITQKMGIPYALLTHLSLYKANQPEEENKKIWLTHGRGGWNISPATARKSVDAYNNMIRSLSPDIWVIDIEKRIPSNLIYLKDDVHLTDYGYETMADEIVHEIKMKKLVR